MHIFLRELRGRHKKSISTECGSIFVRVFVHWIGFQFSHRFSGKYDCIWRKLHSSFVPSIVLMMHLYIYSAGRFVPGKQPLDERAFTNTCVAMWCHLNRMDYIVNIASLGQTHRQRYWFLWLHGRQVILMECITHRWQILSWNQLKNKLNCNWTSQVVSLSKNDFIYIFY